MKDVGLHVFSLARLTALQLKSLRHWNGLPLVEVYADSDFSDVRVQGGIVAFNLKRSDGSYIGYVEVKKNSYKVVLRNKCKRKNENDNRGRYCPFFLLHIYLFLKTQNVALKRYISYVLKHFDFVGRLSLTTGDLEPILI